MTASVVSDLGVAGLMIPRCPLMSRLHNTSQQLMAYNYADHNTRAFRALFFDGIVSERTIQGSASLSLWGLVEPDRDQPAPP